MISKLMGLAPSVPTTLSATAASVSQINLAWTNTNPTLQTRVYRGGTLIATKAPGVSTHNDTGLGGGTAYSYTVRSINTSTGMESAASNTASATTFLNAPTSLSASAVSTSQVNLTWTNTQSDLIAIFRDGAFVTQVGAGTTSYSDTGRAAGTGYSYVVRHVRAGQPDSANSNTASSTTYLNPPTSLSVTMLSTSQLRLNWANAHPSDYTNVYRNGGYIGTIGAGTAQWDDSSLSAGTGYSYFLRHGRGGLPESANSNTASGTTALAAPYGLSATAISSSQITLNWNNASGDNIGIWRYISGWVYLGAVGGGTTSWTDSGLPASTTVYYNIAHQRAGLPDSAWSNQVSATTFVDALILTYSGPVSGSWNFNTQGTFILDTPGAYTFSWNRAGTVKGLFIGGGGDQGGGYSYEGASYTWGGGGAGGWWEQTGLSVSGSFGVEVGGPGSERPGGAGGPTTWPGIFVGGGGQGGTATYYGNKGQDASYASGGGGSAGVESSGARGEGGPAPYGNPGYAGQVNPGGNAYGGGGGGAGTTPSSVHGGTPRWSDLFGGNYCGGGGGGIAGNHGNSGGGHYGDGGSPSAPGSGVIMLALNE